MIRRSIAILLALVCCSAAVHARNRNGAIRGGSSAGITPCAPGVVYVKLKLGSQALKSSGATAHISESIAPSGGFAQAMGKLAVTLVVPFDPAPVKDSIDRALGIDRMYCLYYSDTAINPHAAVSLLMKTGECECGSVRYLFPESMQTNDSLLFQQYSLVKMNVFNAWDITTGDTSIVIADVDCAIDIDHEDLKNEIKYNWGEIGTDSNGHDKSSNGIDDDHDGYIDNWEGWDLCGDVGDGAAFKPNNNPRPREPGASHGTHTAGCIVATGNNKVGIAGVAYGCRLLPIKVAGSDFQNISAGPQGIHYACNHGARVINCSWGGMLNFQDTAFEYTFLYEAIARNALVVAAAGNGLNDNGVGVSNDVFPEFPGNGPGVLSIGATNQSDQAASFSNYGHSVGVWAPGQVIWSCDYTGNGSNSEYGAENGTSFAAPNAAGVAGLVLSKNPSLSPQFLVRQLVQTADNVINTTDRADYWGRIDADSAVSIAPWPGIVITQYALNGVTSDSLGAVGQQQDLKVTFEDEVANGTNISVTLLPDIGYAAGSNPVALGSLDVGSTKSADFQIARSGVYSSGRLPVRFFVTDGKRLADTLSLYIPLTVIPGFVQDISGTFGTGIKRVSNSVAWSAFGSAILDSFTYNAEFAGEAQESWNEPATIYDGTLPAYNVEAIDSNNAYFGASLPQRPPVASVIFTDDGGQSFSSVDVSSFTPFVNSIHFFDPLNGILIGDPISGSGHWGIGITDDGGDSWNPLANPITASGTIASWNNAAAWVGDKGWFGTNSHQIMRTSNRGQSWASVQTGSNINALALAFNDDGVHGFACFTPVSGSGSYGMMQSSDAGATWHQLTTLPAAGIAPGSIAFVSNSNTAILTSNMGVYRTTDYGATWHPIGIPVGFSTAMATISASRGGGEFVVSINSASSLNGVASYTETMPDSNLAVVDNASATEASFEVYPNPVTSNSQISFTVPASGHVQLTLYDALGRKAMNVLDAQLGIGTHEIPLDAHGLAPGAYYLNFERGTEHEMRVVTILP